MLSLLVLAVPAELTAGERWGVLVHSRYVPPAPNSTKHPKSYVEEVRIPRDARFGLWACSRYRGGRWGAKGRMHVEVSLWRPQRDGSLVRIGQVASGRGRLRTGEARVCPLSFHDRALAGDLVRFELTFTGAPKISFPGDGIVIHSDVGPKGQ